jgi:SAM-dependent methyltransferase
MAEHFPDVEVVAIDRSEQLLKTAGENTRASLQCGDIYGLPFREGSFDFVYARLVFMHLQDPIRALQGLRRVLRPGGRILIEDADRECMFFEPAPDGFADFWRKVQDGQRRLGGDPNVGRKLAHYLKRLDFQSLRIEAQPIIGSGPEVEFMARTLLPTLNMYLDPQDRTQGEATIRALGRLAQDPLATFYHFWFAVSGEKPS